MPLYEYECSACHRRTEKIQKFSDPELTVCPFCAGKLERTITAAAVSFKGGGWFKDGYGSVKPPAAAGDTAPAAAGGEGSGGGKDSPAAAAASDNPKPSTPATPAAAPAAAAPAPAAKA